MSLGERLGRAYGGRRVLVTGHTGFKGSWLTVALDELGSEVFGLALPPCAGGVHMCARVGQRLAGDAVVDVRDREAVAEVVRGVRPVVVFHLAAQALVPAGFADPIATYETNVVGTAAVLAACQDVPTVGAVVVVTSDKVYENDGAGRPFVESDRLGGGDPYSASKAAAELVVSSWRHSFARRADGTAAPVLVSARAGNVIGGGDVAEDRLVPDVFRALATGAPVRLRNPGAVRPWQHVLDPVTGYLEYGRAAMEGGEGLPASLNFGPSLDETATAAEVVDGVLRRWGSGRWEPTADRPGPEAPVLTLDASLAGTAVDWKPRIGLEEALDLTVAWHRQVATGDDAEALTAAQVRDHFEGPRR